MATKKRSSNSKSSGRKYGAKAQSKISKVMHEYGEGKLHSGRGGKKVTSQKQASLSASARRGAKATRCQAEESRVKDCPAEMLETNKALRVETRHAGVSVPRFIQC